MAWPKATDFIEAVQDLARSMEDEELRGGEVARTPLGLPMLWSGNFADVFKIHCPATGNTWALKCFTREVRGLHERYHSIASHLEQARLPFTVDFQYLEQGICIGGEWFPVLKMRWVEGLTLSQFVEDNLDRPGRLKRLSDLWLKLATRLREAEITHADLQHGNVLLVPMSGGSFALRLVDYDGMYVPALAGTRSGEVGHPAYQHPQRLREGTYNAEVDRFSHLTIYCGIHCLMLGRRELWQRFNNGDNLLFREEDFRNPRESKLFRVLWKSVSDPATRAVFGRLVLACERPLEETPLLDEIVVDGRVLPLTSDQEAAVSAILTPLAKTAAKSDSVDGISLEGLDLLLAEAQAGQPVAMPPAPTAKVLPTGGKLATRCLAPLRAVDHSLLAIVGQDNTVLHNFLRIATFAAVILLGCWLATVWRNHVETPISGPSEPDIPIALEPLHFRPVPPQTIEAGKPITVAVTVENSDVWKGKVQFNLGSEAPSGASIDAERGVFKWTPAKGQTPGRYDVALSVETSNGRHDKTILSITVIPPLLFKLTPIEPQSVEVGKLLKLPVTLESADAWNGKVRFSLGSPIPPGATIITETGEFTWTPAIDQKLGTYDVTVSATGPGGQQADTRFSIEVIGQEAGFGEQIRVFKGPKMTAVAFAPDGKQMFTGTMDGTTILWDARTGKQIGVFEGNKQPVISIAVSPMGKQVLTGLVDHTAVLWDVATGRRVHVFEGGESSAFSPDGEWILTGSWLLKKATLWETLTGKEIRVLMHEPNEVVRAVAFSPDGTRVLTGCGSHVPGGLGKMVLWDVKTGTQIRSLQQHDGPSSVAFSQDSTHLLAGFWDRTEVWDATMTKQFHILMYEPEPHASCIAFSPDGKRVLTGFPNHTAILWDAENGKNLHVFKGHKDFVHAVAFSPDGKRILTGATDGTAILWNADMSKLAATVKPTPPVEETLEKEIAIDLARKLHTFEGQKKILAQCVAFSNDGQKILTELVDPNGRLCMWDTNTGKKLRTFSPTVPACSVAFSPDGRQVLYGGLYGALSYDATSRRLLSEVSLRKSTQAEPMLFSPDGRNVLTGTMQGEAFVTEFRTGTRVCTLTGHTKRVAAAAFSADGQKAFTSSSDGTGILWNTGTGERLRTIQVDGDAQCAYSVALRPDGRQVIVSGRHSAELWDIEAGTHIRSFHTHASDPWGSPVAFSPDGQQLLIGDGNSAILWDAATGQPTNSLSGHSDRINAVAFSPNGQQVLTGSNDGTVILWGTPNSTEKQNSDGVAQNQEATGKTTITIESPKTYCFSANSLGSGPTGGDLYYHVDELGVGKFFANNLGQRSISDMGQQSLNNIRHAPQRGYTRSGIEAVVGHSYAQRADNGNYIFFEVVAQTASAVTIVWRYHNRSSQSVKSVDTSPLKEISVDLGRGVSLEMVLIPAGEFLMGSPDSDRRTSEGAKPQHQVQIARPFYLGKYLVTQEQWEAVMGDNPSRFKGARNPVEQVSWDDCQEFLNKLNAKAGAQDDKFSLPTEAQWEYACRAGSTTRYCFGDKQSGLGEYAWYAANSRRTTHPVGEKKPNAWGLYDMHGNVMEWCQDRTGPATASGCVVRGGSFGGVALRCTSANSGFLGSGFRGDYVGLRVCRVAAETATSTPTGD